MTAKRKRNFYDVAFKYGVILFVIGLWSTVAPTTAFFWSIFLIWWAFRFDSKIVGGVALIFLLFIPLFISQHLEAKAERFAVYVFLLLAITAVLQVIEYRREQSRPTKNVFRAPRIRDEVRRKLRVQ